MPRVTESTSNTYLASRGTERIRIERVAIPDTISAGNFARSAREEEKEEEAE